MDKQLCKQGTGATKGSNAGECGTTGNGNTARDKYGLKTALGDKGAEKWPKISGVDNHDKSYTVDSTEKISGEMAGFNTEEKKGLKEQYQYPH
ncbi:MAG: hypothetical protein AB8U44_04165 [Aaplasma endosymbiont of Hyalomma asiaticum]